MRSTRIQGLAVALTLVAGVVVTYLVGHHHGAIDRDAPLIGEVRAAEAQETSAGQPTSRATNYSRTGAFP